jgi:hypothetical protein
MSEQINFSTCKESERFFRRADGLINPHKLTIEEVKREEKFRNITDEQAKEIIDGLYKFSIITYNIYMKELRKGGINE